MADDVADRDPEAPAADREQVVPVAAQARALRRREVAGRGLDPGEGGELLGEERALQGLGDAALLVELGVVDRERGAVGGELEEVAVGRGEVAGGEGADVEHADHAALDEERDAEEAADPLLAEQRVEDVGVVDVGDDDRAPLGRDAPREAAADGDPDALLDLLLDALGGPRAQHAAVLLEHEDGGGVGVEDLAHAVEQRAEQVLRGQVGERGVGDALDGLDDAHGVLRRLARTLLAFEEPGVVDRERGAVGRDLQEVAVLGREVAGGERPDVQDADDASADEQWDAEEAADPLLAEDRVEDVGVVDVGDDDRAPLGGHAAGEAAADGDADALLDLLLDPLRRAGAQHLVVIVVDEEERRRVAVEELGDAFEQLGEEVVQREVGERGLRDALDRGERDARLEALAANGAPCLGGLHARMIGGARARMARGRSDRPRAERARNG